MATNPLAPPLTDPPRDEIVRAAQRVEEFLRDDVIRSVLIRVEQKYIEEMIRAETSELRAKAQGKIHATRAFAQEMAAAVESGVHELTMQAIEQKRHEFLKGEGLVS